MEKGSKVEVIKGRNSERRRKWKRKEEKVKETRHRGGMKEEVRGRKFRTVNVKRARSYSEKMEREHKKKEKVEKKKEEM